MFCDGFLDLEFSEYPPPFVSVLHHSNIAPVLCDRFPSRLLGSGMIGYKGGIL